MQFPSLALASILVLCAVTAPAQTVDCSVPGTSLNAVLAGLDKNSPHTVTISGTCQEAVVVESFKYLALVSTSGAILERLPSQPWTSALLIKGSENVAITGLTFQGTGMNWSPALVVIRRSNVTMRQSTIRSSTSIGIEATDFGSLDISGSTIQDNGVAGISIAGHAYGQISAGPTDLSLIQRNGTGISVTAGGSAYVGNVTLQENATAVSAVTSERVVLGTYGGPAGPTIIHNTPRANEAAVMVSQGGELWITPPTIISDNAGGGALASYGGRLIVCCSQGTVTVRNNSSYGLESLFGGQLHFWGPALIEENRQAGVNLHAGTAVFAVPDTVIRRNGDPADIGAYGGIRATMDSTLITPSGTVSDNYGPGIYVRASTASIGENAVISGNRGYGVHLELNSTAEFSDNVTVSGNRRFDLVCASGSVAGAQSRAHPAIGKMRCPSWTEIEGTP